MADSQKAAREFVLRALQKTGWKTTRLAREAGLAPSTLNRFMNDKGVKHTLSSKTLSRIAQVSGLPDPFEAVEGHVMPRLRVSERGEKDLQVMGIAVGGEDEMFELNGTVVDRVARPGSLNDVPDAFAVYMRGSSMEPKYTEGQLLYVDPHRPVRAGDYVIVEFVDRRAIVKRYVKRDGSRLVVEQLNPEREELFFDLSTVRHLYKIVHSDEV